jgi:hypothetical protein
MIQNLKAELTAIMQILQEKATVKWQSPDAVMEYGHQVVGWMARTGEIQAEAKRILQDARAAKALSVKGSLQAAKSDMPATAFNRYVDDSCSKENELYELAERCNKSCTHTSDWLRTVLSTMRAEMSNLNFNNRQY